MENEQIIDPALDKLIENVMPPQGSEEGTPEPAAAPSENFKALYEDALAKATQYEQQLKQSQYPNQFVKALATQFQEGKSPDEILRFAEFNLTDYNRLDPETVIKMGLKDKYPGFTSKEIDILFNQQYPSSEDGEDEIRQVKLKADAASVIESLNAKKIALEPIKADVDPEAENRRARTEASWKHISNQVATKMPAELKFEHDDPKAIGGSYDFTYKVSPEKAKEVEQALADFALGAGLPLDEQGLEKLVEYRDNLLFILHGKDMMKAMVADLYASLSDHFSQMYSGQKPQSSVTPDPAAGKKQSAFPKPKPGMV